ncbi:alpha/beta hydrolase fold-domain-containing protein [Dichomitus squalens]|uniref:Alpha/beta hydrolase fold-domain-containing protein n=1 Tax=Dichomitus squalens TaxID=114155 RepID=A0A4Q9NA60_9APHY|nr:alpha/beta hydrolase fold-domain-containing protein [Dichomitus squalens]
MAANPIPSSGNRTTLADSVKHLLSSGPTASLHLGGVEAYSEERRHHTEILGWHNLPEEAKAQASISEVEFTALRTEHGTISVRVFYPKSGEQYRKSGDAGALVYMHGGGYTVGCVDDFEHGLRTLAEASACQVYAVEYHLAPEYRYPTQLDEFSAVINWLQGPEGKKRGIHPDRVAGGGDSAGGNMTAALALRRRDEGLKNMCNPGAQLLVYPEARLPFNTKACQENNSGLYLEANGVFFFADHYLPRGVPPATPYVSPGMQDVPALERLPPALVFTAGFDPLRDVGVEYASKLQKAGNSVHWTHHADLTHGFLQFGPWSEDCLDATKNMGKTLGRLVYSD